MNEEFNSEIYDVEEQKIEIAPQENIAHSNKGLKVFCIALAAVFLLSCCSVGGYFLGRIQTKTISYSNGDVNITLNKKPNTEELSAAQIYNEVAPYVVGILVYNDAGKTSEASGVIYSENGYIVTNDHIYSEIPSAKFKIYFYDGLICNATYVAGDTRSDLAVLKITDDVKVTGANFGDSSEVISGEMVCAIGCPNGYSKKSTITAGIVSAPKVRASITSNYSSNFIQTDTAINPGNSGGALVNAYGQVIGITSSKIAGAIFEGIAFAIPSQTVKKNVESLILNGNVVDRAQLGVSYYFFNDIEAKIVKIGVGGLYISEVNQDSDLLGKVEKGDIVTRINDVAITDDSVVLDLLEEYKPGEAVLLTVYKSTGEIVTVSAALLSDVGSSSYVDSTSSDKDESSNAGEFNWPEGY